MKKSVLCILFAIILNFMTFAQEADANLLLDESPASEREWGYHPEEGFVSSVNPPAFTWRPQKNIKSWEVECISTDNLNQPKYQALNIYLNVHCPSQTFPAGKYTWKYRGIDSLGNKSRWSKERSFSISESAAEMPMPSREDLYASIPKTHPRLFMRPEDLPELRNLSQKEFNDRYEKLVQRCEYLLSNKPPTAEPLKYPDTMVRYSYEWTKQWWGTRLYVINALDAAATLAFTHLLNGKKEYADLAKQILLDCAKWDPKGSTGYRYNDEAGMPYTHYFSRAYTFLHNYLSEEEKELCRNVARIRGSEMYHYLCPRQLWDSYVSHNARAWHFLGEMSIAFWDEVEGTEDWLWFALNVTYNEYPVWADDDGGWHEGFSYWHSYLGRFNFWAYALRSALNINVYKKPYFTDAAGYYAMYVMPPGRDAAEFGDGAVRIEETNIVPLFGEGSFLRAGAHNAVPLMSRLAAESGNGHWQWYVEQMGGPVEEPGYLGFTHPLPSKPDVLEPVNLPSSRLFRGIGLAALNSSIFNANNNVQILFKSSQMGTQSHGIESNNSFVLWGYGQRLLIRTGHYYMYGSPHHADWVWDTKSQNNITVNKTGQVKHSPISKGKITYFRTTENIDLVIGEAGDAYRIMKDDTEIHLLDRYSRAILFIKPELVVVFDRIIAKEPSTFEYHLHALNKFLFRDEQNIAVQSGDVECDISILAPQKLSFRQTDQYDPNPWEQIKVRDWHFTAETDTLKSTEFITLFRTHKKQDLVSKKAGLEKIEGGYILTADVENGKIIALLPVNETAELKSHGLETKGEIIVQLCDEEDKIIETIKAANQTAHNEN